MNRESIILKYLIVIVLFILVIYCFKSGLIGNLISSSVIQPTNNVYTVEVNRHGHYYSQLKSIVKQLFPDGSNISDLEKYQVLHDFVMEYLEYDYDAIKSQNNKSLADANNIEICFKSGQGVCGAYAYFYEDLCEVAGLRCDYISGFANFLDSKNQRHAWNAVYIGGKCYHVDVCWDDTGASEYEFFARGNNYINVNKAQFRTWSHNCPFSDAGISRDKIKKDIVVKLVVK